MDHDRIRESLRAEIAALVAARNGMPAGDEREATNREIGRLQDAVDTLDVTVANELGAKVDAIIRKLDEVIEAKNLDAASALGRSARRLRELRDSG